MGGFYTGFFKSVCLLVAQRLEWRGNPLQQTEFAKECQLTHSNLIKCKSFGGFKYHLRPSMPIAIQSRLIPFNQQK